MSVVRVVTVGPRLPEVPPVHRAISGRLRSRLDQGHDLGLIRRVEEERDAIARAVGDRAHPVQRGAIAVVRPDLNALASRLNIDGGIIDRIPHEKIIAIEFEVTEIFEQTPKVGTGELIKS